MSRNSKKQWSDLSAEQRAAIVGAGAIQLALHGAALIDLRRRPGDQVNGRKALWVAVSFVNFIGPLAYFAFGRRR
jgi:hypothetical protein